MSSSLDLTKVKKELFNDFEVNILDDKYSFFHIDILNNDFYSNLFDYFFCEDRLIKYAENKSNLKFTACEVNYITLFKLLEIFIDSENIEMDINCFKKEIIDILKEEHSHKYNKIGNLVLRLDKIGKIGEYLFTSILWEYFHFDCIIPKVHLSTDPNMNVYGIDTLFYSSQEKLLLFGESKLTNNIDNGVKLIRESLINYERQIVDEYRLVLSNRIYKKSLNKFHELYGDITERCINIHEFIDMAKIKKIGIPIFIAHGREKDIAHIMKKISSIEKIDFFGIETIYYFISLPIINKDKLVTIFTEKIRERRSYYESERNKCRCSVN